MSALVRCPNGRIKLMIKGADTVIFERLGSNNPYSEKTLVHLEEYATEGLRTLCIAYRDVSDEEYAGWSQIYDKAATTINNRSEALDAAAELIEKDLFLLGATAIEDKLQDGVPDTIATLAQAGIKLWVLTGDRQETAINIGYSCKLITDEMSMIVCNESTHHDTRKFLLDKLELVRQGLDIPGGVESGGIVDGPLMDGELDDTVRDRFAPFKRLYARMFKKKKRMFNKDVVVDAEVCYC